MQIVERIRCARYALEGIGVRTRRNNRYWERFSSGIDLSKVRDDCPGQIMQGDRARDGRRIVTPTDWMLVSSVRFHDVESCRIPEKERISLNEYSIACRMREGASFVWLAMTGEAMR